MDPNETALASFYHHHHHQHHQPLPSPLSSPPSAAAAASNGLDGAGNMMALYPQSVAGKAPSAPTEPVKRKRGRPRKYEAASAAAKRGSSSSRLSSPVPAPVKKKEERLSSKKTQLSSIGSQGFTPHVISVSAGEDVAQKIMVFMQQARHELCILSAAGSISNASLQQPATSGGNVTYEGRFDIISLSGSYIRTDHGGRSGGLSACLSSTNGQIVGGGIGGPLIAAGPVEVIVATFTIDPKKDATIGRTTLPVRPSASTVGYIPFPTSTMEDHHSMGGGSPFIIQSHGMHMASSHSTTDWRAGASFEFMGNTGHESSENGDQNHMPD